MAKAREILMAAKSQGKAIGAFNVCNWEILRAVVLACQKLQTPVIIEASDGEVNFMGKEQLVSLVRIYEKQNGIPIILNLDHAPSKESCIEAIDLGFDYVHFDGSKLPIEENMRMVKEIVDYAHTKDVLVEGEFTPIAGSSADHRNESVSLYQDVSKYTDPGTAKQFVEATGVDTLAVFIGNAHGIYQDQKRISLDQLIRIHQVLPNTFLSLHGGSGIPAEDVKAAIKSGIVKINVNSELRLAYRETLKQVLATTGEIAAYKYMAPVVAAVERVVEEKIKIFSF